MSHLIKNYAVCQFSYFRLWYLKSLKCKFIFKAAKMGIVEFVNSADPVEAALQLGLHCLNSKYDIIWRKEFFSNFADEDFRIFFFKYI